MTPGHPADAAERWERRPKLAAVVRAVIILAPALLATLISYVVGRTLPTPHGAGRTIGWWAIVLATSGLAVFVLERLFRRLLPLTVMLNLALVFPGIAPSRFTTAFRAGTVRNLETRIEEAKAEAADAPAVQAASTVLELVAALGMHDPRTHGHSERTRTYADLIAEELDLSDGDRDRLRWSALLHDVGKLHVHSAILNKPGKPDEEEWEALRRHPMEGARLAAGLREWLGPWALAIEQHHEKFDGSGYPKGLVGHDISLGGRIVAVGDTYDVMTATRSYTTPVAPSVAREELVRCAGTHFDPEIVRSFLRIGISKFPRRAGLFAAFMQLPWFLRIQQLVQNGSTALVTGAAVAGLAVTGVVAPPDSTSDPVKTEVVAGPSASSEPTIPGQPPASVAGIAPSTPGTSGAATPPPTTVPPAPGTAATVPRTTLSRPPAATTTTMPPPTAFYLKGTSSGQPATPAELTPAAPGSTGAPDYDADGAPGRTLAPSSQPTTSTDPKVHQLWVAHLAGARTVGGTPTLTISSAVAGFGAGRGDMRAVLSDCDAAGGGCTRIATASLSQSDWSGGASTFQTKTLTFTASNHLVAAGRTIVLAVGAQNGSQPLLIVYGTSTYPSVIGIVLS